MKSFKLRKPTRSQFYIISFIVAAIVLLLGVHFLDVKWPGDVYSQDSFERIELDRTGVHWVVSVLWIVASAVWIIALLINYFMGENDDYYKHSYVRGSNYRVQDEDNDGKTVRFKFRWLVIPLILLILYMVGRNVGSGMVNLYNTEKTVRNAYQQKVDEKKGFYDKLWKTYLAKEKITNVNKETFLEVTKIIMENRKDGQNIAWKWLHENQQIPYEQFTVFYADLSGFIQSQREGYFQIEKDCQILTYKHNTLIDTFPNNFYNRFLGLDRLVFSYGMTSDSTEVVFESGRENVK